MRGNGITVLALQRHVDVTCVLVISAYQCGAENFGCLQVARIVTEDRYRRTSEQPTHRYEVDAVAPEMAGGRHLRHSMVVRRE